jgi:hypothetical protein
MKLFRERERVCVCVCVCVYVCEREREREREAASNCCANRNNNSLTVNKIWSFVTMVLITIIILDISRRLVFTENTTFLRLNSVSFFKWNILSWASKVELFRVSDRKQKLSLSAGPNWVYSTFRRRQNPVFETLCLGRWILWIMTVILMYNCNKPVDLIKLILNVLCSVKWNCCFNIRYL